MASDDVPGKKAPIGGVFVDLTATRADGSSVRVLLVDTLAGDVTSTGRERAAAARIGAARPRDELRLVPKARDKIVRSGRAKSILSRAIGWARRLPKRASNGGQQPR